MRAEGVRINHIPSPGPDYWDWRCLICDAPVSEHAGIMRNAWVWVLRKLGHDRTASN